MKGKFRSRSLGTTSAPFFTKIRMTNALLLFLCISECSVYGQRVFWLYQLPQRSNHYHEPDHDSITSHNSASSAGFDKYNSVSRDSRWTANRNVMKIVPLIFEESYNGEEPTMHQRHKPQYAPLITPLIFRDHYGYGSARKTGMSKWQQPQYNSYVVDDVQNSRNSFGYTNSADEQVETMLLNQNILELPKSDVIIRRGEDEENDSGSRSSSGSGSTEIVGTSSMERISHFGKVGLVNYELETPVVPAIILNQVTSVSQECGADSNYSQARFHAETNACYTVGTQGPCGDYMIFTTTDSLNGHCECDQGSFKRPLVQIGEQCHFLYTQALCPPGFWLTLMAPNTRPDCQPNPCALQKLEKIYHHGRSKKTKTIAKLLTSSQTNEVLFKGECVSLNSASRHCRREGEVVLFPEGSTQPACGLPKSKRRLYRRQISNVRRFSCKAGMRRHRITKKCVQARSIIFG